MADRKKRAPKPKQPAAPPAPEYPKVEVVETFNDYVTVYRQHQPSCVNGVDVERFRITITTDRIEEPEAWRERLQAMWEQGENHHYREPIMRTAARLGVTLTGEWGAKRRWTRG